ncbi:MAG: glycoside hydrolase family 3 C-terminal domain-containing protein [Oscillospiraceae bacterium]|nr:glycoside hydrolase family 3 C-terminal domain-containing protein [Oscillospiraceae bacterium]MBQ6402515.1 glycoside hydrolase family 3 C-terminal domain-containing protein [Oscillospiraceae bacterium]
MQLQDYERDHLAMLRPCLAECTVLLKKNGAFPLDWPCDLALYGSGARRTVFGGTGSGEVNARHFVSIEEGLEQAGFRLTTKHWLDQYDEVEAQAKSAFLLEIRANARKHRRLAVLEGMGAVMPKPEYDLPLTAHGDAAVYVLSRISGEGSDRSVEGDVLLTKSEIRDILALDRKFDQFLLVLNVGGPVDLSPVQSVGNILLLSQLGTETGSALADILLGRRSPSGKLSTTWAAWEDYPRLGDFGARDDTRYRKGVYVGYRYFDSVGKRALYPFGFGLSYADFELQDAEASVDGERVTVSVTVENVGEHAGKETAQLYVSVPWGRLDQPFQTLAAFSKSRTLYPGEKETLTMSFDLHELASFDASRSVSMLEAGDYVLRLGQSSVDAEPVAVVRLEREVITAKLRALEGPDYEDWKPENPASQSLPELPVFTVDPDRIPCLTPDYDVPAPIDPLAASLSDETLAMMSVGAFDPKGGALSVIGNASTAVPGAAGESSHALEKSGVPFLVMADGPAGLRLTRTFARDRKGVVPLESTMPATIADLLPGIVTKALALTQRKPLPDAEIITQYCTAIPIGTALAQSWNLDLARLCGDLVGAEMERFGVQLWLAPALNLHRDIRCGRNFEYYSEDPLLSGRMAAAVTRGVQAHPGRAVTIKHYCANNQETNRFQSNSQVSHRALRELYLRGFGIAVRESCPRAVMSSYNLLNGVHTSERRDLIEDVLRAEFGFDGLVMTDWLIAQMKDKRAAYPIASPARIPASGNDVVMPGTKGDCKCILNALRSGELDRDQVRRNVSRLIRLARELSE